MLFFGGQKRAFLLEFTAGTVCFVILPFDFHYRYHLCDWLIVYIKRIWLVNLLVVAVAEVKSEPFYCLERECIVFARVLETIKLATVFHGMSHSVIQLTWNSLCYPLYLTCNIAFLAEKCRLNIFRIEASSVQKVYIDRLSGG